MKVDVSREIGFRTARSGGKGGQHVNKVETMVEGYFWVEGSLLLSHAQKDLISKKLRNRINKEGMLQVKSQQFRTQLQNKEAVIKKMNALIEAALRPVKKRVKTQVSKAVKEKRLEQKKMRSAQKQMRRKPVDGN